MTRAGRRLLFSFKETEMLGVDPCGKDPSDTTEIDEMDYEESEQGEMERDERYQTTMETNVKSKSDLILLKDVPNLEQDFEVASVDLMSGYWTPNEVGETKRLIFWGIVARTCLDQKTGEEIELDCVQFLVPDPNGEHTTLSNGSMRLVDAFTHNVVDKGQPVQVKYLGKKKNKTNQKSCDHWSVVLLAKKGSE